MKKLSQLAILFALICGDAFAADMNDSIKKIQDDWANAKYNSKDKKEIIAGLEACAKEAHELSSAFPQNAEPVIWEGICLSSQGEYLKMTALPKVKAAKALFEKALTINDKALSGAPYTNLGVLYHRVPGWPIGFGDKKKAEENFKKAMEIAPENIDANYFYAMFLIDQDRLDEAKQHLETAAKAPGRNRPLADAKRKEEIAAALKKISE